MKIKGKLWWRMYSSVQQELSLEINTVQLEKHMYRCSRNVHDTKTIFKVTSCVHKTFPYKYCETWAFMRALEASDPPSESVIRLWREPVGTVPPRISSQNRLVTWGRQYTLTHRSLHCKQALCTDQWPGMKVVRAAISHRCAHKGQKQLISFYTYRRYD